MFVVGFANAVVEPCAMMVKDFAASVTLSTMFGLWVHTALANGASIHKPFTVHFLIDIFLILLKLHKIVRGI